MRPMLIIAFAATACSPSPDAATPPALYGLLDARVTETGASDVVERMSRWAPPDTDCAGGQYGGLELKADVVGSSVEETILASYTQGVIVLDRENMPIASAPGYPCEGSADAIESIAVGHAFLEAERTIAMTVTSGGRREQMTVLALFRVGFGGRLDPVFTASIEERRGGDVARGSVMLLPGALLYRRPGGRLALWVFDPVGRAYLFRGVIEPSDVPEEPPHVPPLALR